MKLSKEEIEKISTQILNTLKEKKLVIFKADEKIVLSRVIELFMKDIMTEDELDREVHNMIKIHEKEMEGGRLDYKRMFNLIKSKLARERGIVL